MTLEQHGFKLYRSTNMRIFFSIIIIIVLQNMQSVESVDVELYVVRGSTINHTQNLDCTEVQHP